MPAYNIQGAPATGRLPGLPAKRNVVATTINQYFSTGLAEKIVAPVQAATPFSVGSGNYLWAAGRAANVEGLGLAFYSQSGTYRLQAFTYGDNAFQMVGAGAVATLGASGFGGNTLRLWDGSFLTAHRTNKNSFCRTIVAPDTYAITQDTAFMAVPTSGTCVSGEAFTCTPTGVDFGYSPNAGQNEPAWFVDGMEIDLFGTIDIYGVLWVAAFVFNSIGQLVRVHKIFTFTKQTGSLGTALHVRRVNSYYHICALNKGPGATYTTVARYGSCRIDFSDISVVYGDITWSPSTQTSEKLLMAADSKALIFFVVNMAANPYTVLSTFARVYKLDGNGKAVTSSANSQLPAWTFNTPGYANANSLLQDLFDYTTYNSSADRFIRVPDYAGSNRTASVPAAGGYLAVSLNHTLTEVNQAHIYKGGYKFNTLSDANDDLLMRFTPTVAVNQVDNAVANAGYAAPLELFELSGGYWLALQILNTNVYQLTLHKEQA